MTLPLIFFISFFFGFSSGIADVPSAILPAWEAGLRIKDSSQILTISTDKNGAIELEVKPKRSESSERSIRYFSQDGLKFTKAYGERATGLREADAGRVVELAHERGQKLRRYFVNTRQNWVQSELSEDGGATYRLEAGYQVGRPGDGAKFLEPILVWKTARDENMLFLKREKAGLVTLQKYTSRDQGRSFKLEKQPAVGFPSSSAVGALMKRSDEIWYFAPTSEQGVSVFISSDGGLSFVEQNELALKAPATGSGFEIEKIESLHPVEVKDGVRLYVGALLKKNHGRKNSVLSAGYLKSQ